MTIHRAHSESDSGWFRFGPQSQVDGHAGWRSPTGPKRTQNLRASVWFSQLGRWPMLQRPARSARASRVPPIGGVGHRPSPVGRRGLFIWAPPWLLSQSQAQHGSRSLQPSIRSTHDGHEQTQAGSSIPWTGGTTNSNHNHPIPSDQISYPRQEAP
jgi:hypothetical protein